MTTSQKNAIFYKNRSNLRILQDAIMRCCDLYPFYMDSSYAYVSNFLKYKCGVTIKNSTVFCNTYVMYFWLKTYLDMFYEKRFYVKYIGY